VEEVSRVSATQNVTEIVGTARESLTARRVYAEPVERDGTTLVPAARISGGLGGGAGKDDTKGQNGEGGGFAVTAHPVGAYELRNGEVTWRPAIDVNRLITVAGAVTVVALLLRARRARMAQIARMARIARAGRVVRMARRRRAAARG
jgi:uncharacterized spore protein YtfJ